MGGGRLPGSRLCVGRPGHHGQRERGEHGHREQLSVDAGPRGRHVLQRFKRPEEIPLRARNVAGVGRVGNLVEMRRHQHDYGEQRGKDHTGALLDEENLQDAPGAQELAGQKRIGSLLKELESRKFDFAAEDSNADKVREPSAKKGQTTNDIAQGNTDPVGTHQNKIYRKPKGN